MSFYYTLTSSALCIYGESERLEIPKDHPNFKEATALILGGCTDFETYKPLMDIVSSISSCTNGTVELIGDKVYYNSDEVHNAVVDAILDYRSNGLPIEPICKFLENLMQNPSKNSIEQLWRFIDHHKLPLTEDGMLLAYKAVRSDYKDKFSGRIDNSIGNTIKMARNTIDDNPDQHCSQGLHVGGLAYSGPQGWYSSGGDTCVIVKVNPRDVVCVPHDHNSTKIRVCEYAVVKDYCKILKSAAYSSDDYEVVDSYFEDYEDKYSEGDLVTIDTRSGYQLTGYLDSDPDEDGYFVLKHTDVSGVKHTRVAHTDDIVEEDDIPF